MGKRAVIAIDIQNEYFPGGKLELVGISEASDKASRVLDHARQTGDLVIHVRHEAQTPDAPVFTPGSDGVKIHSCVQPLNDETVIVKNYPNSFRNTALQDILQKEGVTDVVLVGAMSHMCIDATARASADLGYQTTVVHDACATRDLEFNGQTVPAAQAHATLMAALAFAYGKVLSAEEYLGTVRT